jgi:hypothetical protein
VRVARVVEDVRTGDAGFVIAADLRTLDGVGEDDELLRVREGEGAQEHTFDDGEDGGGGADAEGQHEDGGERETGRFGEMANGDLQVTQHEKLLAGLWLGTAGESNERSTLDSRYGGGKVLAPQTPGSPWNEWSVRNGEEVSGSGQSGKAAGARIESAASRCAPRRGAGG